MGDVSGVNWKEKLFATLVIILSTFTYIYFFGNMASIIKDVLPIMKSNLDKQFSKVLKTIKALQLDDYQSKINVIFLQ